MSQAFASNAPSAIPAVSTTHFRTREIEPGIWQLSDVLGDRAYLVVGERRAVLVDTCAGYGDIRQAVRQLTSLPITVLLTHAHYDHVGGSWWFDEAYISQEDDGRWDVEAALAEQARKQLLEDGAFAPTVPFAVHEGSRPQVRHVADGDTFDLGGLTVEAIALPGHTTGSMGYLVRERRVLLSGDAVTPIMCLFFEESLGIPAYRETLAKMSSLPFERFYTGHHDVAFARTDLPGFDACAAFAQTDRGITWQHAVLPQFVGTIHLAPCAIDDVDAPEFRALIGPYVPRPRRHRRARKRS